MLANMRLAEQDSIILNRKITHPNYFLIDFQTKTQKFSKKFKIPSSTTY